MFQLYENMNLLRVTPRSDFTPISTGHHAMRGVFQSFRLDIGTTTAGPDVETR